MAQNAEDLIDSHIAERLSSNRWAQQFTVSPPDLQKVIEEFDSAKEEMMKIIGGDRIPNNASQPAVSSRSDPNPMKILVGFTGNLNKLKGRVFDWSAKLEIIPIVGMGGIGKTTLARNLYDDPSAISCFDVVAWTTVSQEYSVSRILVGLLSCITGNHTYDTLQNKEIELGITLYKNLIGRRYLVVLDDMWHPKAWDAVKMYFPNEQTRSRIILTTRESDVATYVDPKNSYHKMHLLDNDDSWELLRRKVFGEEETCPPKYEKLGIEIAKGCRGLPLAIHVIGGILSQTTSWEQVANDVSSTMDNKDEHISRIFSLSYNHLPHHLRPCFLYMGAFPEDYEIRASKIIRLWIAEGFLRPIKNKSAEEAAEAYLKALVNRNLIFIRKQDIRGKVKTYGIHDLLRDICVRKARQKKFLYVKNEQTGINPEDALFVRRLSVHTQHNKEDYSQLMQQMSLVRTFLYISPSWGRAFPELLAFRLLKELDVLDIGFLQFPEGILELVNLRYLAFTCGGKLPKSIIALRNLQTLVFRTMNSSDVTSEIFHLPQLRHIKVIGVNLSCDDNNWTSSDVNGNLQTMSIFPSRIFKFQTFLRAFINLKRLAIYRLDDTSSRITDFTHLNKLETLKLFSRRDLVILKNSNLSLPHSLKKLTLFQCILTQTSINTIGILTNLEILILERCTFENPIWEPSDVEFQKLQLLSLKKLNLVKLKVDQNNFPRLQHLIIQQCSVIEEISTDLGEIPMLELFEVDESSHNVADTAKQIAEEQREYGNELLQVRITAM